MSDAKLSGILEIDTEATHSDDDHGGDEDEMERHTVFTLDLSSVLYQDTYVYIKVHMPTTSYSLSFSSLLYYTLFFSHVT